MVVGILEKMNNALEELKRHSEVDNTSALRDIETWLDSIQNLSLPIDYNPVIASLSKSLEAKITLNFAQNTHNTLLKNPNFDLGPVMGEITSLKAELNQNVDVVAELVSGIQRDDGYTKGQLVELRNGVNKLESQGTQSPANMDMLTKKVDSLNKFVVGVPLAAGGAALVTGAFKFVHALFGKKHDRKTNAGGQADVAKKVVKPKKTERRFHARSRSRAEPQSYNGEISSILCRLLQARSITCIRRMLWTF